MVEMIKRTAPGGLTLAGKELRMSGNCQNTPRPFHFDPFEDRTARDIRNRLSAEFVLAIESGDFRGLTAAAASIRPAETGRIYGDFIRDRVVRYRRAFDRIRSGHITGPIHRAVLLWNERLFFEVHEVLESVWNGEERWRKEALRGLIQAAGVYVHRKRGADRAAGKLALRAVRHLKKHRHELKEIANLEELIEALGRGDREAPVLRHAG